MTPLRKNRPGTALALTRCEQSPTSVSQSVVRTIHRRHPWRSATGARHSSARGSNVAGHFEDAGKSGWDPSIHRPGFEEMMAAVRGGHVDAVVVFSLSRLTRRGAPEAMRTIEELESHGVRLVSVEEPYLDTSTPVGVGIPAVIADLAQQESDMKSAYVSATKDTLRRAGSHVSGLAP
ncbi:hypothetical protein C0216_24675 [Streptomyces globosus]|uniref:Resolvase/invertase-type recombinase catalytic domain-containing protein n=1 Tax=Streptomyces globosus TaxID=68209 RepID=A0A344U5Q7_9ACTN|nr:recombinase family protein [Streptomyces globosus]AXE26228.1 hypothetical protein C0216_24675 [Streptomyces globosus]